MPSCHPSTQTFPHLSIVLRIRSRFRKLSLIQPMCRPTSLAPPSSHSKIQSGGIFCSLNETWRLSLSARHMLFPLSGRLSPRRVPNLPAADQYLLSDQRQQKIKQQMSCTWIIPKPSLLPRSIEKLSSTKPVPGAKKGWGPLFTTTPNPICITSFHASLDLNLNLCHSPGEAFLDLSQHTQTQHGWPRHVPKLSFSHNALSCFILFSFWPHHVACEISVPQPGTEPGPWQGKRQVLTTGWPGNAWRWRFWLSLHEKEICEVRHSDTLAYWCLPSANITHRETLKK